MPVIYSNEEYADMIFVYGYCNGSTTASVREYQRRYPNRRLPDKQTFSRTFTTLRLTGAFPKPNCERELMRRNNAAEVLEVVENDPGVSTRRISLLTGQSRTAVQDTLRENGLHPYHYQPVQELLPTDLPQRVRLCEWWSNHLDTLSRTLFCDEATFTRDGINNFHNEHVWAIENPHAVRETHFQRRFSVNVWAGIVNNEVIGPHIFDGNLNSEMYRAFLENELPLLLEDIPLQIRRTILFLHDGAPAHYGRGVTNFLNEQYPNRWIGRGGPIAWPPRSPDLNPLDFFMWGHVKTLTYSTGKPDNRDQLIQNIHAAFNEVKNNMENYNWERELRRRIELCIAQGGGHIEQL